MQTVWRKMYVKKTNKKKKPTKHWETPLILQWLLMMELTPGSDQTDQLWDIDWPEVNEGGTSCIGSSLMRLVAMSR